MMKATSRSISKSWAGEEVPLSCGSLPDWVQQKPVSKERHEENNWNSWLRHLSFATKNWRFVYLGLLKVLETNILQMVV